MFETHRLVLRAFRPSDADIMLEFMNDVEVQSQTTLDAVVPRTEKWKENPQKWAETPGLYVVVELKETGEMMGSLSLNTGVPKNRDATFGIALGRKFMGKGYGTEAMKWAVGYGFKELGLHRVQLTVHETNERAIAAYRKVGFVEEGRLRKGLWKGGKFIDIILMSILVDEWSP
ncbi:acyl-CoA N-acyltransferase [Lactarius akahatsu]|uniref:Acyl-CoA N-acyltransferase n=1 Tax=Lactarius akahatsu TaxID=416441 RepID=A0AAD4LQP4_9AGAM|nr:acyl-CoA N-acyltransferase [Lactarius akahatsu]